MYTFFRTWWHKRYEWGTNRPSTFGSSYCTPFTIPYCRNHRLALCLVYLLPRYRKLLELDAGGQREIFQGRRGFVECGHFDKHFVKNRRKRGSAGKSFVVFFSYTFWMENLTQRWIQSGPFFPKSGHFSIFKKGQGRSTTLLLRAWSGVLRLLWKIFKYRCIKLAIFEQAQEATNLKPRKVLKACTTRWLTHGESCVRIISMFQPLIDALDVIFFGRGDAEAKRSQISFLIQICCWCYYPINILSSKLKHLIEKLPIIKDSLSDPQLADSNLSFFDKAAYILYINGQTNYLERELDKVSQLDPSTLIQKFWNRL